MPHNDINRIISLTDPDPALCTHPEATDILRTLHHCHSTPPIPPLPQHRPAHHVLNPTRPRCMKQVHYCIFASPRFYHSLIARCIAYERIPATIPSIAYIHISPTRTKRNSPEKKSHGENLQCTQPPMPLAEQQSQSSPEAESLDKDTGNQV